MRNEKSSENRGVIRSLVRWFVTIYYPQIEIVDGQRISQTKPVLLCANHCNSLIDPIIIGIAARRPVRFMAKAPLFEHPILGPPMTALGMVPAFRTVDDAKQVRRNFESLDVGAKVLTDGLAMGIFPEGRTTDQSHLEMVRSGAARMAIQAVEDGAEDVQVVPIGIAYERKERFRTAVLVRIGRPIEVAGLLRANDGNVRKARHAFTAELESRLKEVVIHLDEPEWEEWLSDLETLVPPPLSEDKTPSSRIWQRKRIADAMNHFLEHDRPRADSIAKEIKAYRDQVHSAGLRVESPVLLMSGLKVAAKLLGNLFWLVLFFLPALFGTLYHIFPFVVVQRIATRMDQPGLLTISTHRLVVGVPVYFVWVLAVTSLVMLYSPGVAIASLVAAPVVGVIAVHYRRRAGRTAWLLYHETRLIFGRIALSQLRSQLVKLREHLGQLSEEYATLSPRPPASESDEA